VIRKDLPGNVLNEIRKAQGKPKQDAIRVAPQLTVSETPTIFNNSGSKAITKRIAE
jgi:hypothetical protein